MFEQPEPYTPSSLFDLARREMLPIVVLAVILVAGLVLRYFEVLK